MTQPPNSPPRSSLLYAMGRLEAQNENQSREIAELPQRIAAEVNPRIVAVEKLAGGFNQRLVALERWNWVHIGTIGGMVVLGGVAMGLMPQLVHIRL